MDLVNRFEVYLISLNPTKGSEIKKTRPCLIVSPNEMNHNLRTVLVAPLTTSTKKYPTRVLTRFQGKQGDIVLDQIRAVDQSRLIKSLGKVSKRTGEKVLDILQEMFS